MPQADVRALPESSLLRCSVCHCVCPNRRALAREARQRSTMGKNMK